MSDDLIPQEKRAYDSIVKDAHAMRAEVTIAFFRSIGKWIVERIAAVKSDKSGLGGNLNVG